jgi:ACS family glucarate transporter-like MFS transporter
VTTAPASDRPITSHTATVTRTRYKVLTMTVLLAAITYLDRVCIAVTAPAMRRDLNLSPVEMSFVFSAFTLAYAIFEIPTGRWADRVGTRRILLRIVTWWSTFTILTGAAFNYGSLLVTRFLFGAGEAGAWPNVAITFARWFPQRERGTVQGIFFSGAHLAGGLTPLLVTALMAYFHWRVLFVLFGSIGFIWAFTWYRWFRDTPAGHPSVSPEERAYIESGCVHVSAHGVSRARWKQLFTNRTVLFLCLMYFTQVYGFYLYITWLPTYLNESRGFSSIALGLLAGLPLTLSAVADVVGGIVTDVMTLRFGLRIGRAVVGSASLAAAGVFLISGTFVANPVLAAVLISLAAASSNFLLGAAWGTCVDIGGNHSGVVSAAMNSSGAVGGILSPILIGFVVQHFATWTAPLYFTGLLYLLGALCWLAIDPERSVDDRADYAKTS